MKRRMSCHSNNAGALAFSVAAVIVLIAAWSQQFPQ
jgi:hypothetical protein